MPTPEQVAAALAFADAFPGCNEVQMHLKALAGAVPQWINVNERKPVDGQRVLCVDAHGGDIHSCEYRTFPIPRYVHRHTGAFWSKYITHWMPAPGAPTRPAGEQTS